MNKLFNEGDFPKDFFFQIISLFISIIIVHTVFLLFIDPAASLQIEW